jgi:putative oxidoreductase
MKGVAMTRIERRLPHAYGQRVSTTRRSILRILEEARIAVDKISISVLRVSVGVIFIWFGALKLAGASPVSELVAATVPFVPAGLFVPALGVVEVLLGIALLIGRRLELVAALLVLHLSGTFLVLVMEPSAAFANGNPMTLTMTGEFVVKNIVLIAAALVLATKCPTRAAEPPA